MILPAAASVVILAKRDGPTHGLGGHAVQPICSKPPSQDAGSSTMRVCRVSPRSL